MGGIHNKSNSASSGNDGKVKLIVGCDRYEKKFPVVFTWVGGGKKVCVSGSFSKWKPLRLVKTEGDFRLILELPEGDHQYKFQVDGQWLHNPEEPTVGNDYGSRNNVLSIKESDFLAFEELSTDKNDSPPGSYSQKDPHFTPEVKAACRPPTLHPLMKDTILNKNASSPCEPNLLDEPNHVILNHAYLLSIQDGAVIISTTRRYRSKYVTTIFYKSK